MVEYICMECQYIGSPRRRKRGSGKTEFFMWLMFPIGLPYTFWRMLSKTNECRHCASRLIHRTNTLTGHKLVLLAEAQMKGEEVPVGAGVPAPEFPQTAQVNTDESRPPPDPAAW